MSKQTSLTDFISKSAEENKSSKKRTLDQVDNSQKAQDSKKSSAKKVKGADGAAVVVNKKKENTSDQKTSKTKKESNEEEKLPPKKSTPVETVALVGDCFSSYERFIGDLGSWQQPLSKFLAGPTLKDTFKFLKSEYSSQVIFPPQDLIFNAFKHVPFDGVRVVIVGQDPYIKDGEAMGLSFSIPKAIKCPPSLKNIYKALENDPKVGFKMPTPLHGDLSKWAAQGVLLLNAILTVRKGASNSHQKHGWEQFTTEVINVINRELSGVVFILWGLKAQEKAKQVDSKKHLVLKYTHPSPLAGQSFTECKNFSDANDYLKAKGVPTIDWNV